MAKNNIEEIIKEILLLVRPDIDFETETELISDGLLESLDIVEIVAQIEETLNIVIPPSALIEDNFKSFVAIVLLVKDLCGLNKND